MREPKKIDELPKSDDPFWDGEKIRHTPQQISLCETHHPNRIFEHSGYINRHDGTVMCKYCPWGALLPGHLRVENGRLIDLNKIVS